MRYYKREMFQGRRRNIHREEEWDTLMKEYHNYIESIKEYVPDNVINIVYAGLHDQSIDSICWCREGGLKFILAPRKYHLIFHGIVHTNADWKSLDEGILAHELFVLDGKYEVNIMLESFDIKIICKDITVLEKYRD